MTISRSYSYCLRPHGFVEKHTRLYNEFTQESTQEHQLIALDHSPDAQLLAQHMLLESVSFDNTARLCDYLLLIQHLPAVQSVFQAHFSDYYLTLFKQWTNDPESIPEPHHSDEALDFLTIDLVPGSTNKGPRSGAYYTSEYWTLSGCRNDCDEHYSLTFTPLHELFFLPVRINSLSRDQNPVAVSPPRLLDVLETILFEISFMGTETQKSSELSGLKDLMAEMDLDTAQPSNLHPFSPFTNQPLIFPDSVQCQSVGLRLLGCAAHETFPQELLEQCTSFHNRQDYLDAHPELTKETLEDLERRGFLFFADFPTQPRRTRILPWWDKTLQKPLLRQIFLRMCGMSDTERVGFFYQPQPALNQRTIIQWVGDLDAQFKAPVDLFSSEIQTALPLILRHMITLYRLDDSFYPQDDASDSFDDFD